MPPAVPLLALLSAVCSAAATIFIRQGLREGGVATALWVNLLVGTLGLWTAVLLTGGLGPPTAAGLAFFVLAGIIGTVTGRLLRFAGIEKVGASISAALGNLHPFVATGLAILFLGEQVTLPILAGTVVIVAGTVLLSAGGRRLGYRRWHLTLPVLSAVCFGIVAILRKLGLTSMGAVAGSAVNVTTALAVFAALLLVTGQRGAFVARGRSLGYFIAAGVAENTGVFLNVVALGLGTVSVVSPLYASAPLFVLVLSALFLRDVERLSARVVAGTLLIVGGVVLLTALGGP